MLTVNANIRKLIADNTSTAEIHQAAVESGMVEMRKSGIAENGPGHYQYGRSVAVKFRLRILVWIF
jgi:type II secretory ATPase GspE/PulE/Tfp pilus assembly ATPase PilB-like protein